MNQLHTPLVLVLACLATACGSDSAEPVGQQSNQTEAPAVREASLVPNLKGSDKTGDDKAMTIASLVPEGSTIWIRVSSFNDLGDLINEFMGAFNVGMDFETVLAMTPLANSLESIDRDREMGWAISFDDSGEPKVTMMMPSLDRGAVIQSLRALPDAPQCFGLDDYVVATTLDEYRPGLGSVELTDGLPEGQVSVRVNLEAIMKDMGPMVEMGLGQLSQASSGMEGAGAPFADAARMAIDSAESLDLTINLEAGEVDFSMAFVATPNSKLDGLLPRGSTNLSALARCLEDDDAMSMMVAVDSDTVQDLLMPLYSQLLDTAAAEGEVDTAIQALMLEWGSLWPVFGNSIVTSVETGNDFNATYYFQPPDLDAFRASFDAVLHSLPRNLPGVVVSGPTQGASEEIYEINFSQAQNTGLFSAMSNTGKLNLRLANLQDISVLTVGTKEGALNEALSRITRSDDQMPEGIRYALDRIGDANPAFLARVDLVALARDVASNVEGLDVGSFEGTSFDPDQGPLHLTYYGGVDGRYWRFGLRTDISELSSLAQE